MICSPSPWHSTQSPFWANHSRHRHDYCNDNLMKNFSCWFHHPLSTKRQILRLFPGGIIDSLHLFYNISALKMQAHTLFLKRNFSTGMLDLICTNKLWCGWKWKLIDSMSAVLSFSLSAIQDCMQAKSFSSLGVVRTVWMSRKNQSRYLGRKRRRSAFRRLGSGWNRQSTCHWRFAWAS